MMSLGPILETQRLILRPPRLGDLSQWVKADSEDNMSRNNGAPDDNLECHSDILKVAGSWALNGFGSLLLVKKDDNVLVGRAGPSRPLNWPDVELGWALLPEFTGRGYALEGAAGAMDFALGDLGFSQVIHTIRPSNIASQKLAERLGSSNTGPTKLPPPYSETPNDLWRQTKEEWQENRRRHLGIMAKKA